MFYIETIVKRIEQKLYMRYISILLLLLLPQLSHEVRLVQDLSLRTYSKNE